MELGIVGLGRMGAGMARRLARGGVRVVCYDSAEAARKAITGEPEHHAPTHRSDETHKIAHASPQQKFQAQASRPFRPARRW